MFLKLDRRRSSALTKAKQKLTKIVLIGSSKSGKTALAQQFVNKEFSETYKSTVEEAYFYNYKYGERHCGLEIVDLPSPFDFPVMRDLHVKSCHALMLIYEVGNSTSYDTAKNAWEQIKGLCDETLSIVVVGTKIDLVTDVRKAESEMAEFCNDDFLDFNINYIMTSAKNNKGVDEAFHMCIDGIFKTSDKFTSDGSDAEESDGFSCKMVRCCCFRRQRK